MIYLIQPPSYPKSLYRLLKNYLSELAAYQPLMLVHQPPLISSQSFNTYFIINDKLRKDWSGLDMARRIRQKDPHGHIVLLTRELDYLAFFRSHVGFLAVIDLAQAGLELEDCLTFILQENRVKSLSQAGHLR